MPWIHLEHVALSKIGDFSSVLGFYQKNFRERQEIIFTWWVNENIHGQGVSDSL